MAARRATTGEALDYRAQLWSMADALRNNMDAAEYKHVVLGLIFLKYISDAFEERHARVLDQWGEEAAEDRDEYIAENIFWVPPAARWSKLQAQARQPTIGTVVDDAMVAIERENPALRDVLPKDYARPALDKTSLGRVIDLVSNIKVGGAQARATDALGSVYEYFLEQFALAEGRRGGEFYTPRSVVRLLVEMLQPYRGRVYDPCCGSSGMFVQSIEFIQAHATGNGNARSGPPSSGAQTATAVSIYGQESNYTTWRMARMNLAIRGIEGRIAHGDSFHNDRHPDLRADYILANPPFNVSDWGGERLQDDQRWRYGVPPRGNANFAWVQHFLHHLAPHGRAGFVLANGSMSSSQSGEGQIRKNIVQAGLVDCIVALPGQLFRSTQSPACLWFLSRDKSGTARRDETLFIDARNLGHMLDRTRRDLSPDDITRIATTYRAWRNGKSAPSSPSPGGEGWGEGSSAQPPPETSPTSGATALYPLQGERQVRASSAETGEGSSAQPSPAHEKASPGEEEAYTDIPGFCKSATLEEIRKHNHVLTPGRYVGAAPQEDDGEPFEEKMARLTTQWRQQQAEARRLDEAIEANLARLGFGK
jgi:type I restriction enzyme M protein